MKTKHLGTVAIAAVLALWAPAARATNGMRMTGFGAVQDAMGGVGAALPLDASTIVTNPAGLSALERRVDLSGSWFGATVKYRATGAGSGRELESDRGAAPVPNFGLVLPSGWNDRLTLGLGGFVVAGLGVEYPADLYGGVTESSFMNLRLAPAASFRVTDRLSVGAAVNLTYATLRYEVGAGIGMVPRDTAGSFGAGATIGLQYRASDAVTLGAAYESHTWLQAFEFDVPPNAFMGTPAPGGTEKLDFDQPQSATAGVAVRPLEALVLAADVQWIRWSETNGAHLPEFDSDYTQTGGFPWNMRWKDQWVYKVGAELAATRTVKVRAGYNYGRMPLVAGAAFENLAYPAIAEHHLTAGLGVQLGRATVNLAGLYSPEARRSGANAEQLIASYETTMTQYAVDLGVGYRF